MARLSKHLRTLAFSFLVALCLLVQSFGSPKWAVDANALYGIYGNGLGGINIDVNSAPFTSYTLYAYTSYGCGWFATARATQLTGKTYSQVFNHEGWWNYAAGAYGYAKGTALRAPALACWSGHVAVVEKIVGNTVYISEGGYSPAMYANYGYTRIAAVSPGFFASNNGQGTGDFWGFVYLGASTTTPTTWDPLSVSDISNNDAKMSSNLCLDSSNTVAEVGGFLSSVRSNVENATTDNHNNAVFAHDIYTSFIYNTDSSHSGKFLKVWYSATGSAFTGSGNGSSEGFGTSLTPATNYYFKFYGVVNGQTVYSGVQSFTTTGSKYQLSVYAGTGGTITSGSGALYSGGDTVTLTAAPNSGYSFVGWQSSSGGVFSNASSLSTTFTMPSASTTVTAVFKADASATKVSMYRLYNPNSGEHFYTKDVSERNKLSSLGWKYEGIGWIAPVISSTPVFRLYNPNAGEHHYTTDTKERNNLVKVGWKYEGIGWYSDDAKTVPVYREYNPNAFSCNHNYTTDKKENDWLVSLGWKAEGIGWYGM